MPLEATCSQAHRALPAGVHRGAQTLSCPATLALGASADRGPPAFRPVSSGGQGPLCCLYP